VFLREYRAKPGMADTAKIAAGAINFTGYETPIAPEPAIRACVLERAGYVGIAAPDAHHVQAPAGVPA
jgi:hypothetical protein